MKIKLILLVISFAAVFAIQNTANAAPTCKICDSPSIGGIECSPVTEVEISNPPVIGEEYTYWVEFDAGETISYAKMVMKFESADPELQKSIHKFEFPGGGSDFKQAFSLNSGDLIGPALLKIKSEAGTCTYAFNVVSN